jgi:PAS domain S-box-containing protein
MPPTDVDAILRRAVEEAARLLRTDGAMSYLLDETTGVLSFAHDAGITDDRRRAWVRSLKLDLGVGMFGRAVAEGRVVVTGDYLADASFIHFPDADRLVRDIDIHSFVVAPLVTGSRTFGAMGTFSSRPDAFGDADVALVRALADHAAAAMANADLIRQLDDSRAEVERRAGAERALREMGGRIIALRDPAEVLQFSVDEAARLLRADGARIDVLDEPTGALYWAYDAQTGRRPGLGPIAGTGEAMAGEGISGRAIRELRAVFTGDYLHDDRFEHAAAPDEHVRTYAIRSVVAVPLIGDRGPLGTLTVYTGERDAFTPDDARLIEALAGQAAIAMTNARLIAELDRSRTELARRADAEGSLREIAARLTAIRELGPLLQQVVDAAKRLVDADGSVIDLVDTGANVLRWTYDSGVRGGFTDEEIAQLTIPIGVGATGIAVAEGRIVAAGDDLTEQFPASAMNDRFFGVTGFRSMIIAPITGESGPLGAIEVYSTRPNAFDQDDSAMILSLATQAAIAIHNARLIEELRTARSETARRAETEQALREIAARITAIREPGDLLQHVVDEAARLLGSDGAIIDLLDPVTGALEWGYDSGIDSDRRRLWRDSSLGEDVVRRSLAERAVLFTADYLDDSRFDLTDAEIDRARTVGLRSLAIAPLVSERGALGTLTVFSDQPGSFGSTDADLLGVLADQAAIAMTNAHLIAELERSQIALEARAETERSLRDISARITSLRDPDEVLARVVEESRRLLGSDGAHLTRIAEDGTYLVPVFVAGGMDEATEAWLRQTKFPLGGGINGLAAEEIRPIWTYDYGLDPRIPHEEDDVAVAKRLSLRAMAAAPLRAPAGEVIGTLAISYREPREIAPDELDLLQGLADQAAIALTNSNLYELLGESEARYRHLVQNSPDLVWSIDADARFTFVSDTCERLTGWRPEELLGKHFGALVHETSADVAQLDWTEGMTEEFQELRGRLNLLHRDGHAIPAEFSAFGTLDPSGAFAGANGSVRDMSERDRLERELRESEERYRFLVENAPDMIFSIDTAGTMIYISESVHRALGYPPEDLIGRPFRDIIHYLDPSQAGLHWAEMEADPTLEITSRLMLIHRDGRHLPFEASSRGVVVDGVFAGIHGSARDVSERERLERELRASEERYRFLVENSPDVVFSTDIDGHFTYLSETIERMTGHPPAELVGGHFSRIIDEASWPAAFERWNALIAQPDREQIVRLNLVHRERGLVPVEVSAIGTTIDGRFVGIHGATRDVSERERLETGLRRQAGELASSQERAHLARELHDSVTQALFSMTLVTRTTELLVDRDPAAAKEKLSALRDLQREALAEMRALIFELRPGNIEQDGLLAALKTHTAALQGRIGLPIVVTSELTDRLPLALEEVLYRISQEALHNVVKHAAAHQVTLTIERVGGGVRLRIVDDGKGFDAASVPDGHLGLAGMRARADKIGGILQVTSRAGSGTTIEVIVPEAAIAAAADGPAVVSSAE